MNTRVPPQPTPRVFQGDGLGLLRANIGIGLGLVTARRIPFNILIEAHDIPGGGIDLVVILLIAGEKLHIIHRRPFS